MALIFDIELDSMLTAAGNFLLRPPSSLTGLLHLLDQIEELLSKVEQSPYSPTPDAFSPLKKALAADELLKHPDADVKACVGSCISEILRISAPDAPYDDDTMKDVFQLIVSCFENLSEVSSRLFRKRAVMLEIMAKVRTCVVMLDLEGCAPTIVEMFQHFLRVDRHDELMFASMETIMTLVLAESEDDVCQDLLDPILATLNWNNSAAVTPMSKMLAERVILNSGDKITPFLAKAVKSLDADFEDFGEVVASVCAQEDMGSVMDSVEEEDTINNGTGIDQIMAGDIIHIPLLNAYFSRNCSFSI